MDRSDASSRRSEFVEATGFGADASRSLLDRDPGYFAAALALARVPATSGVLDDTTRAMIRLAVNVAVTHLDPAGTRRSVESALARGVSEAQVLEVCQLTSVLGIQSCVVGLPMLAEELTALGRADEMGPGELDAGRQELKDRFVALRGYWSPLWDTLLKISPAYFRAYIDFSSYPWKEGTIPPRVKELIYVAIDAATNHLFEPGIRIHVRNALNHGATAAEISEVLQIASLMGIESAVLGAATLDAVAAGS